MTFQNPNNLLHLFQKSPILIKNMPDLVLDDTLMTRLAKAKALEMLHCKPSLVFPVFSEYNALCNKDILVCYFC